MSAVRPVFHLAAVAYYITVSHWVIENLLKYTPKANTDPSVVNMHKFTLRYLTNWTFALQAIFFIIALGEDILSMCKGLVSITKINALKNYVFTVLTAPMALLVSLTFWSIWMVDRELIFPRTMDQVLPPWLNHSLHTVTSVLVLVEMFLTSFKYPAFKHAVLGITVFMAFYLVCFLGTYFETGVWLYPVMKLLSWTLRIVFCLVVYALALATYGAGFLFNNLMWGEKVTTKKAQKKKHKK